MENSYSLPHIFALLLCSIFTPDVTVLAMEWHVTPQCRHTSVPVPITPTHRADNAMNVWKTPTAYLTLTSTTLSTASLVTVC